jgi:hypothetical protein
LKPVEDFEEESEYSSEQSEGEEMEEKPSPINVVE